MLQGDASKESAPQTQSHSAEETPVDGHEATTLSITSAKTAGAASLFPEPTAARLASGATPAIAMAVESASSAIGVATEATIGDKHAEARQSPKSQKLQSGDFDSHAGDTLIRILVEGFSIDEKPPSDGGDSDQYVC